ncbi:hypothetical protein TNCV_1097521 [Trichonephila clavipes]|nr:hypothetical protein TNCV_1097521 [Trichonephila clavipes]
MKVNSSFESKPTVLLDKYDTSTVDIICNSGGSGGRVVKVKDRGWPCHEFEPNTTKDPSCRAAMHFKSVES